MSEIKDKHEIEGHNDLRGYLDELFPACAPHHIVVMSDQEFKQYQQFKKQRRGLINDIKSISNSINFIL